jgi:hypothetical protein
MRSINFTASVLRSIVGLGVQEKGFSVQPAVFSYVCTSWRLLGEGFQVWCWFPVVSVDGSCFCLVVMQWLSSANSKLSLSSLLDVGSWLLDVWFWVSGVACWLSVLVIAQFSFGSDHLLSYLSFYSFIHWRHLRVSTSHHMHSCLPGRNFYIPGWHVYDIRYVTCAKETLYLRVKLS